MKKWYQSKTMWVSIATTVVGAITGIVSEIPMSENTTSIIMIVLGMINSGLRLVTSTPIGSSE